jgi:carboxymethylenebutenolidase
LNLPAKLPKVAEKPQFEKKFHEYSRDNNSSFRGGSFSAYLAIPTSGLGSGLLVIQEIFGVNQVMRAIADAYAEASYLAIVPDLFWRQAPGIQLTEKTEGEVSWAFELYEGFSEDKGTDDLIATLNFQRRLTF